MRTPTSPRPTLCSGGCVIKAIAETTAIAATVAGTAQRRGSKPPPWPTTIVS